MEIVITAGGFSSLLLQGIKWIVRKFIVKDMGYDFPVWFYDITLPVLNVLVVPLLAFIGFSGFEMPTDWVGWIRGAVQILIATAISLATYSMAIKPMREYARYYKTAKS